jgi:hypothetical protein
MKKRRFAFLQVSKARHLAELAISAGSLIICLFLWGQPLQTELKRTKNLI